MRDDLKANCAGRKSTMSLVLFLTFALAMALNHSTYANAGSAANSTSPETVTKASPLQSNVMKMRLTVNGKVITADLIESETTRDFISLLPLTLTMNDLFGREKFGRLPRAISEGGKRTRTYEVGDVIYWSPGPDVAIFYHHDGPPIPSPGIIVMGRIDSGVDALNVPGSVKVMIERVGNQQ
jgi:hypothetical protein